MHFSLAIASAILASTAIASQDFARRDPYADTEALISQNAHLYARDAYASAYADAYHELSARWAAPEPYLDEPYFEERDLEEHYLEARDLEEYYLEKRVGPEEQRNARLREAGHHIADAIPQTPVKSPIITIGQKVAKVTAKSSERPPKSNPNTFMPGPGQGPAPGPARGPAPGPPRGPPGGLRYHGIAGGPNDRKDGRF